jgi:hypothetical protein
MCDQCRTPLAIGVRSHARFCSARCRSAWNRQAVKRRQVDARDLLMRQTAAVIAGDADEMARVQADAAKLFGA